MFLRYLKDAPLDHHSRQVKDVLPQLIEVKLPSLLEYLDKRMLKTEQLEDIDRGCIRPYSSTVNVSMISSTPWEDPVDLKERIFSQTLDEKQKIFETEVQLRFIDLPDYHNLASPHCIRFFKALSKTSNIAIFELNSIRLLIEFLWPFARATT